MIHSAPLLAGLSLIIPIKANSEHTRRMGRCRVTRADSSFSRCSGVNELSVARFGAPIAGARTDSKAGVKDIGKRWCKDEMI